MSTRQIAIPSPHELLTPVVQAVVRPEEGHSLLAALDDGDGGLRLDIRRPT